ncbi:DcrB family lipoprotein [Musicola keenii]|uniref:DcrB family lipoprotein n=1 Tax=Musicola keenii TaxID=2884250 RepID=UPI00177B2A6A|nr:DcrB family lipoprotein [Musicola keenii]
MPKLVKYFGIGLLAATLAACDGNSGKGSVNAPASAPAATAAATKPVSVSLLAGKLSFTLPTGLSDQTDKLGNQKNNTHLYADPSGKQAIIVIEGEDSPLDLPTIGKNLENQQHARDANLQVLSNKAIDIHGHAAQQLESVITTSGQKSYSSIVLTKVDNRLVTLQITLPADNLPQSQTDAGNILSSLKIN